MDVANALWNKTGCEKPREYYYIELVALFSC